jgi:hypothetical protein
LDLTIVEATAEQVRLKLEGEVRLATKADAAAAERGFEASLLGEAGINRKTGALTRFDLAAVGEHWGEGRYTPGARPGRQPLGVAFELAEGKSAADRVPPQAARELEEYLKPTP